MSVSSKVHSRSSERTLRPDDNITHLGVSLQLEVPGINLEKSSSFSILLQQQSHLSWPPDDGISISLLMSTMDTMAAVHFHNVIALVLH